MQSQSLCICPLPCHENRHPRGRYQLALHSRACTMVAGPSYGPSCHSGCWGLITMKLGNYLEQDMVSASDLDVMRDYTFIVACDQNVILWEGFFLIGVSEASRLKFVSRQRVSAMFTLFYFPFYNIWRAPLQGQPHATYKAHVTY